jgi:RimJ/RimL family protein N-acetyltransferase
MSGRIYLDKINREDLSTSLKWTNDLNFMVLQSSAILRPRSMEDEIGWFESLAKSAGKVFTFNVRTKEDDTLIGYVTYYGHDSRNRAASLGIAIAESAYRNKGYGTEAMQLTLDYGFNELNLNRVELNVASFNPRAIHVYKKIGFIEEGVLRQTDFVDGIYHDSIVMSLLREKWEASCSATN